MFAPAYAQKPAVADFYIVKLEICHCPGILNLQQAVLDALPHEQKNYLVVKNEWQICRNLTGPNYGIGIFNQSGQLVGTAFMLAHTAEHPLTFHTNRYAVAEILQGIDNAGVVGTVMVHPAFRKLGLMSRMLENLQARAAAESYKVLMAKIVDGNEGSLQGFVRQGYAIANRDKDPADGRPIIFVTRPVAATQPVAYAEALQA